MTRFALILACLATAAACPVPVERSEIVGILGEKYAETQRSFAEGKGTVVETYASGAGTWSIVETTPDGKACIVAAGKGWRSAAPVLPGEPM